MFQVSYSQTYGMKEMFFFLFQIGQMTETVMTVGNFLNNRYNTFFVPD